MLPNNADADYDNTIHDARNDDGKKINNKPECLIFMGASFLAPTIMPPTMLANMAMPPMIIPQTMAGTLSKTVDREHVLKQIKISI